MRLCAAKRKSAFDPHWEPRAANWCTWFCARAWFRFWRGWRWERPAPRFPALCWLRCCSKCAPPTRASSRRRESRWWRSAFWPTICRPVARDAWTPLRPCEPNNDVTQVPAREEVQHLDEASSLEHPTHDETSVEYALYSWKDSAADFADCLIEARNRRLGCHATATFDGRALKLAGFVSV